jgi:hypothetical protein
VIKSYFSSTLVWIEAYEQALKRLRADNPPPLAGPADHLRLEFRTRLRQLGALYARIELLNEYVQLQGLPDDHYRVMRWKGGPPAPFAAWIPHVEELIMWVDAFYFIAWRALEVVNETAPEAFPRVRKIKAPGVRDVRNHLLQHPDDTATVQAWAFHPDDGPVVKPLEHRRDSNSPEDRGLFVNAREFRDKVNAALEAAIPELSPNT